MFDDTDSKDIKIVTDGVIEEMNFDNNIEIPSDDEMAVDGPKKKKFPSQIAYTSNRIVGKY